MVPNRLPISMPVCILLVSVVTLLQVAIATVDAATAASSMGDNSLSPEQAQSLRAYLYWMKQLSMFDVFFGVFCMIVYLSGT